MTTEAELLANLPTDGVRVWKHTDYGNWYRAALADGLYWYVTEESDRTWHEAADSDFELAEMDSAAWTEITPAPSLRDQRIAEAWERWPDGRLFEDTYLPDPETPNLRMIAEGRMWSVLKHKGAQWFNEADASHLPIYVNNDRWTEIPRPTPTLPDPSGDLPDGTRVRVVIEGETRGWVGGDRPGGVVQDSDGLRLLTRHSKNLDHPGVTIEVLSIPTPQSSALDGKPGSLWRDPETGTTWARRDMHNEASRFTQVQGKWLCGGSLCQEYDSPLIARLVPAQVADDE